MLDDTQDAPAASAKHVAHIPRTGAVEHSAGVGRGLYRRGKEPFDIPDVRVLPMDALVPHEHADPKRVTRLAARLRTDGSLKNPPIVAPIPDTDLYVVLDGANRVSAIAQIGCPHVLAQVVEYKSSDVQLLTWHHLITGRPPEQFLEEIRAVRGLHVRESSLYFARKEIADRQILAYVVSPEEDGSSSVSVVSGREPNGPAEGPHTGTTLLNAMVDTYKGDPMVSIHRVSSDELDEFLHLYDDISGLIVFPPYSPDDIMELALTGVRVPTGITRHIISHRALRVNVPISFLSSPDPIEVKNAWWHDQIKRKLSANEIRVYQESTYLFDE